MKQKIFCLLLAAMMMLLPFASAEEEWLPFGLTSEMTCEQACKAVKDALGLELAETQVKGWFERLHVFSGFATNSTLYGVPIDGASVITNDKVWFFVYIFLDSNELGFYQIFDDLSSQWAPSLTEVEVSSGAKLPMPSDAQAFTDLVSNTGEEIVSMVSAWNSRKNIALGYMPDISVVMSEFANPVGLNATPLLLTIVNPRFNAE